MNRRTGTLVRIGKSFGIVLPKDWVRGHDLQPGDRVSIEYDERVSVSAPAKKTEG